LKSAQSITLIAINKLLTFHLHSFIFIQSREEQKKINHVSISQKQQQNVPHDIEKVNKKKIFFVAYQKIIIKYFHKSATTSPPLIRLSVSITQLFFKKKKCMKKKTITATFF